MLQLGNAPVSWGVDYADDPENPAWETVLAEIAEAGYRYTELGPLGYYPLEGDELRSAFKDRGLSPVAGFVFQPLHDPSKSETVLEAARATASRLGQVGGKYLVLIDHISETRMATAGNPGFAVHLSEHGYAHLIGQIKRISEIAREFGILPVIHQHAGCFIEFEDEIERVLSDVSAEEAGICIDTGHMAYAGIDPVAFFRRHSDRVKYFHFKDIDPKQHARVLDQCIPFLEAVSANVFCPLGQGVVNFPALRAALAEKGWHGHATVEQDIDPNAGTSAIADAKQSLSALRALGF